MIRFPARRYAGAAACIALIGTGAATLPAVIGQPAAASSDAPALDIGDGVAGLGAAPLLDELPGPDAAPEAAPEAISDAPEPDTAGFIDPFAASAPPPAPAPAAARDQGTEPDLPDAAGDAPLLEDFEPPMPSIAGSEALPPALPAPAASDPAAPGPEPLLPDAPAPASHRSAAASDAPPLDTPATAPPAETAAPLPPAGENAGPVPALTPALAGTVSAALPPAPVAAEAPAEEEPGSLPGRWLSAVRAELEVVAYHEEAGIDGDVADNPGNQVLRLAESRSALELRPTIGWKTGRVELEVSPRLRWNRVRTLIGGERRDRSEWEARISYARAAYSTGPVSVQAGRYVNLWGPSVFLSPSNPFHPRSGQTSPYIELEARDYVEASYSIPDTNWTTSVIYNFGRGDQRTGPDEDIVVGKASWYGSSVAATGLVQASREHVGIGGYGQWTPNDAVVIYGDGLLRRGPERLPRPTARGFETRGGDAWSARVLVGGSYSLTDGTTLSLEYLHNTDGYSRSEAKRAFALRDAALRPGAYLPAGTVGTLASVPFLDLGQNYLLGRVSRNNLFDSVDLSALYAYNVDDGSGRLIGNADWYLSDETSLFVNAVLFQGDRDSEFGRFSDNQIAVGLRWRPQ